MKNWSKVIVLAALLPMPVYSMVTWRSPVDVTLVIAHSIVLGFMIGMQASRSIDAYLARHP